MKLFPRAMRPLVHLVGVLDFCPWCNGIICQKEKKRSPSKVVKTFSDHWMHKKCIEALTKEREK